MRSRTSGNRSGRKSSCPSSMKPEKSVPAKSSTHQWRREIRRATNTPSGTNIRMLPKNSTTRKSTNSNIPRACNEARTRSMRRATNPDPGIWGLSVTTKTNVVYTASMTMTMRRRNWEARGPSSIVMPHPHRRNQTMRQHKEGAASVPHSRPGVSCGLLISGLHSPSTFLRTHALIYLDALIVWQGARLAFSRRYQCTNYN